MTNIQEIIREFDAVIALETSEPLTTLGSYILGVILRDPQHLYETNPIIEQISDLASRLEIKDGDDLQLKADWEYLKRLVKRLKNSETK